MKKIGIIGGAGPEAGALLFKNVIRAYQQRGSWQDHDFPQMTLLNFPFSPMIESDNNQAKIVEELQTAVNILSESRNEVVAIACNTLHSFVKTINFRQLKFISIVDVVIDNIKDQGIEKVLFLGTRTSVSTKIYEGADIKIIYPSKFQQKSIDNCIVRILKNKHSARDSILINKIIDECNVGMNLGGVILGCTDLSVLHQNWPIKGSEKVTIVDSLSILANRLASI